MAKPPDRSDCLYVLCAPDRFAAFFGLAELVSESQGLYDYRYSVRKTTLLYRFMTFTLSAASFEDG